MFRLVLSSMLAAIAIVIVSALSFACAAPDATNVEAQSQEVTLTKPRAVAYNLSEPNHLGAYAGALFFTATGDDNGFPVSMLWTKPVEGGDRKVFKQLAFGGVVGPAAYWHHVFVYATTGSPTLRSVGLDTGEEDALIADVHQLAPPPRATNRPTGITALATASMYTYIGVAGGQILRVDMGNGQTEVLVKSDYLANVVERSVIRIAVGREHLYWLTEELPLGSPLEKEIALYATTIRASGAPPKKLAVYKNADPYWMPLATVVDRVFVGTDKALFTTNDDGDALIEVVNRPAIHLASDPAGLLIIDGYCSALILPPQQFTARPPTSGVIVMSGEALLRVRSVTSFDKMFFLATDLANDPTGQATDGAIMAVDRSKWSNPFRYF